MAGLYDYKSKRNGEPGLMAAAAMGGAGMAGPASTVSMAAGGGSGASAAVAGAGAPAHAGSLDDFSAKFAPALTGYYRECPFLVEKSAREDEVTTCVLFALSQLREPRLLTMDLPAVFKRRESKLPRSIVIEKHKDSFRICVFAKGKIGEGSFKRVKDLLCIDYSLSTGALTISNKALCIRCAVTHSPVFLPKMVKLSDIREAVAREKRRHQLVEKETTFMTLEGDFEHTARSKKISGCIATKVYTVHPRADFGVLIGFAIDSSSGGVSGELLSHLMYACYVGAHCMSWLHDKNYVCVDFKPENIFGFPDHTWRLGDLDSTLSIERYITSPYNIVTASPLYTPPECIDYCIGKGGTVPANPKAHDVWSLGMSILRVVISLGHRKQDEACLELETCLIGPPSGVHPYDRLKALKTADIDRTIELAVTKQPRLAGLAPLLKGMLEIDPAKRISMEEARDGLLAFSRSLTAR